MAYTDKNIVITPNSGSSTDDPKIVFTSANNTIGPQSITLRTYPTSNGLLSFESSVGQLFSISNTLTGTLFSVNDISGIPSITVQDTGQVNLSPYNGNVIIGTATTNTSPATASALLVVNGMHYADQEIVANNGVIVRNDNRDFTGLQSKVVWRKYSTSGYVSVNSEEMTANIAAASLVSSGTFTAVQQNIATGFGSNYLMEVAGYFYANTAGVYSFGVNSDDNSDLFVDGKLVADWFTSGGHGAAASGTPGGTQRTVYLQKGFHRIYGRVVQGSGGESLEWLFKNPGDTNFTVIPAGLLYHQATDSIIATANGISITGFAMSNVIAGNVLTSNVLTNGAELTLGVSSDTWGPISLRLQNRDNQNGPLFDASQSRVALLDFGFKTATAQKNIRYETRPTYSIIPNQTTVNEFQIGVPGSADLAIGNTSVYVRPSTGSTPSTNTTSGALIVAGGAGISGNIYTAGVYIVGSSNGVTFGDGTIQTTAVLIDQTARNLANTTAGGLITANANSFYIKAGLNSANANIISLQTKANTLLPNIGSVITINSASQLYVSNNQPGLSSAVGALTVMGGIGAQDNVWIDGNLSITNPIPLIQFTGSNSYVAYTGTNNLTSWDQTPVRYTFTSDNAPQGITFKPDGTVIYIVGTTAPQRVYQLRLNSAWDQSTAINTAAFSVATQDTSPQDIWFKPDGSEMYILGNTNKRVWQYHLNTPWDINTASFIVNSNTANGLLQTQDSTVTGLTFKPDGTQMYVNGSSNNAVYQYTLSTPWSVNTATYTTNTQVAGITSTAFSTVAGTSVAHAFNTDGTRMFVAGTAYRDIAEFNLNTAWNVATSSYRTRRNVYWEDTGISGMYYTDTANSLYTIGTATRIIFQYTTNSTAAETIADNTVLTGNTTANGSLFVAGNFKADGNALFPLSLTAFTTSVTGTLTASGTLTATGALGLNGSATGGVNLGTLVTTGNFTVGTTLTTGTFLYGGVSQTGNTVFGRSTLTSNLEIANGIVIAGSTKTVGIGNYGTTGSSTVINIGVGSLGNTTINFGGNTNPGNTVVNFGQNTVVYTNSVYATTTTGAIYTDNLRYASNGTPWVMGSGGGSSVSTYSTTIGDGTNTKYQVLHNLGKSNIITTVRETTSGNVVYPSLQYANTNQMNVSFVSAPASSFYTVSIIGF